MFRDLRKALSMFRDMQRLAGKLQEAQEQLSAVRIEGKAGGDLVRVVLDGTGRCLEVNIDPVLLEDKDTSLLQELLRNAITEANTQLAEQAKALTQNLIMEALSDMELPPEPPAS